MRFVNEGGASAYGVCEHAVHDGAPLWGGGGGRVWGQYPRKFFLLSEMKYLGQQ